MHSTACAAHLVQHALAALDDGDGVLAQRTVEHQAAGHLALAAAKDGLDLGAADGHALVD